MSKFKKVFVLLLIVAVVSLSLTGCKDKSKQPSGDQSNGEHPSSEHPAGEAASEEHPTSEHPAGEHPK